MTTFTVWKFETPDGAAQAADYLKIAQSQGVLTIVDHAVLTWPEGADKPVTHHSHDSEKSGAAWGALWGVLCGAVFLIPVAGAVVGAGLGILAKTTDGTGIRKEDLETIRTEIVPGTSALFMVTEHADLDRLGERFSGKNAKLINTNLTDVERKELLATFGGA